MSQFNPTPEQFAIGETARECLRAKTSMAIDAGAGTGKTRVLLYLMQEIIPANNSVLSVMFNRAIKDEMAQKIKAAGLKAQAVTFNGLGYRACLKHYGVKSSDREINLDDGKYRKLAQALLKRTLPENPNRSMEQFNDAVSMLVSLFNFFRVNTTRDHRTGALMLFTGGALETALIPHDPDNMDAMQDLAFRYALTLEIPEIMRDDGKKLLVVDLRSHRAQAYDAYLASRVLAIVPEEATEYARFLRQAQDAGYSIVLEA